MFESRMHFTAAGQLARPQCLPRQDRICLLCGSAVEDVKHFVLDCPVYQKERDRMIGDIASHVKGVADIVVDGVITDPDLFFKRVMFGDAIMHVIPFMAGAMKRRQCRMEGVVSTAWSQ